MSFFLKAEPWPAQALSLPFIQVHRGYCRNGARENTLEAFQQARQHGFMMVELDVHISRDGKPVVIHDPDLWRVAQISKNVCELTASEAWALARIPTLEQVIQDPSGPKFFNIEVKDHPSSRRLLEPAVVNVLRENQAMSRVLISSFQPLCLARVAHHCFEIPRALLLKPQRFLDPIWIARIAKPHILHLEQSMVCDKIIRQLKDAGLPFAVWTVNDVQVAQRLRACGAVSLITDDPDTLNRAVNRGL